MGPVVDRREAIRRITTMLGGILSAPTVGGLMAGCEAPPGDRPYTPRTLSRSELGRVETIAEHIIPETDTPGARAARVHDFIDLMLSEFYSDEQRGRFLAELARVDSVSTSLLGKTFDDATGGEQLAVLEVLDGEAFPDPTADAPGAARVEARIAAGDPPFMRTMKELTLSGYYTSEIGQTVELHLPPLGSYEADVPVDRVGRSWA